LLFLILLKDACSAAATHTGASQFSAKKRLAVFSTAFAEAA